jgi:hypothetical protein
VGLSVVHVTEAVPGPVITALTFEITGGAVSSVEKDSEGEEPFSPAASVDETT